MSGVEIAGIIGAASALLNVFLGFWGAAKKKDAHRIAEGVVVLESAISDNKEHIEKIPGGKVVTNTVKEYGEAARVAVDSARALAHAYAKEAYEARIIAREEAAYLDRLAKRAAEAD